MNNKVVFVLLGCIVQAVYVNAQSSGTITVNGDWDKYYPVTWFDSFWGTGRPTDLIISRVTVHENSSWRGSMRAEFEFHTSQWGHGSNYIDATIYHSHATFVAGWRDATGFNVDQRIIIWLRGGGTTYTYQSTGSVSPLVYVTGYNETNGPSHSYKVAVDSYVNSEGMSQRSILAEQNIVALGKVGIGTIAPDAPLTVKGVIHTNEVRIDVNAPIDVVPDYVFEPTYNLTPLSEVETYIKANKHLPEVPSAKEMEEEGLNLKEMNLLLLKKVEELTLHLIEMKKQNAALEKRLEAVEQK